MTAADLVNNVYHTAHSVFPAFRNCKNSFNMEQRHCHAAVMWARPCEEANTDHTIPSMFHAVIHFCLLY